MRLRRTVSAFLAICAALMAAPAFAGNGQNLLQYVPANAAIVMNVDLDQVRALPLYQMVWGMVGSNPEVAGILTEIQTQTGFDPNLHVNTFLLAISAEDEDRLVGFVEGTFDVARIQTYLATLPLTEITTVPHGAYTLYHDPSEGTDEAYFTFVNDGLVAFGSQLDLQAALDNVAGTGTNISTNAALQGVISATDMAGAFWFSAALTPEIQAEMTGSPLAGVTALRGGGNFSGGLNVAYTLTAADAAGAAGLQTFVNETLSGARTDPQVAAMGLTSVLDSVSVTSAGTEVTVTAAIPEATLNQVIGMVTALMAAEGGLQ